MTQGPDDLDLVHESVIVRDLEGRILGWNAAAAELYGWQREEALGRAIDELLKTSHAQDLSAVTTAFAEKGAWDGELTRRNASGAELQIKARWRLRLATIDRPARIVETGQDITEQRRVEVERQRSDHRYRNLFQAMAASFWELDFVQVGGMVYKLRKSGVTDLAQYFADHPEFVRDMMRASRVIDVNDETIKLFGMASKADFPESVEPFWPESANAIYAASVVAAVGGAPNYAAETKFRRCDGTEFDALFTACFPQGSVANGALLIGVIDISARKQAHAELQRSELRYRNLFHHMPISLWQIDPKHLAPFFQSMKAQGVEDLDAYMQVRPEVLDEVMRTVMVEDVNQRTVEMFGGQAISDFTGPVERFWQVSPGAFRRSVAARYHGALSYTEETRVPTLDGREIDVHYTIAFPSPLNELGVSIVGVVDISDRIQAEVQLRKVQADFAHAARVSMLGELTASIAHEVNQPLAAIATNGSAGLRWLSRPEPDIEEIRELTGAIVADARRAADIISRVRSMAAKRTPEPEALSLDEVIEGAMLFLRHELQAQGVTVMLELTPDLPTVQADRTQVQQVLVNLVVNAAQSMAQAQSAQREIRVATRLVTPDMLEVSVRDSGPGIAEADLERLFQSFFTTKENGMGMGLPICRSIIEAHGGRMDAANVAPAGARFAFTLPAKVVPARA